MDRWLIARTQASEEEQRRRFKAADETARQLQRKFGGELPTVEESRRHAQVEAQLAKQL